MKTHSKYFAEDSTLVVAERLNGTDDQTVHYPAGAAGATAMSLAALRVQAIHTVGMAHTHSLRPFYTVFPKLLFVAPLTRRLTMDLLFLLGAVVLFVATVGLGALCARLLERKS